jgi:hypothetical protein
MLFPQAIRGDRAVVCEARRIAASFAKQPELLGAKDA